MGIYFSSLLKIPQPFKEPVNLFHKFLLREDLLQGAEVF